LYKYNIQEKDEKKPPVLGLLNLFVQIQHSGKDEKKPPVLGLLNLFVKIQHS
jgi:hypothetical protein